MCSNQRSIVAFCGRGGSVGKVSDDWERPVAGALLIEAHLVRLVEDREWAFVLGFRRVLKILNVLAHDLAVGDQKALQKTIGENQ